MSVVIDASALLGVLLGERGANVVIPVLRASVMSAVNVSECCSRAPERGESARAVLRSIRRFEIAIVPFDLEAAIATAALRAATRHIGASLGDRACLALARSKTMILYTGDRRLADVDLGIDIRLIR